MVNICAVPRKKDVRFFHTRSNDAITPDKTVYGTHSGRRVFRDAGQKKKIILLYYYQISVIF